MSSILSLHPGISAWPLLICKDGVVRTLCSCYANVASILSVEVVMIADLHRSGQGRGGENVGWIFLKQPAALTRSLTRDSYLFFLVVFVAPNSSDTDEWRAAEKSGPRWIVFA